MTDRDDAQTPSSSPAPPVSDLEGLDDAAIQRLYGPWQPMPPKDVLALLGEAPFPWWIAGGRAVEIVAGRARGHWDTDVAVLSRDLPAVREWLSGFDLWEIHEGTLRPLLPGDQLTEGREQLWVRRDSQSPWLLDLLLTPSDGSDWLYKRDPSVRRPLDQIGHGVAGIPFLLPSIVLLFKARLHQPKDDADFASLLERLAEDERRWLAMALRKTTPDHPWLADL